MDSLFIPITLGVGLAILAGGLYIWFELDSQVDISFIHDQIISNQTFVDSLDCEKITITLNALDQMISPTQQADIVIVQEDFMKLKLEKNC